MWRDPFTLVIALGRGGEAEGELYLDDGDSFGYQRGEYVWRGFKAVPEKGQTVVSSFAKVEENGTSLTPYSATGNEWARKIDDVRVEKIVVLGLQKKPSKVSVDGEVTELEWVWEAGKAANGKSEGTASRLTIKNPSVRIVRAWNIRIA